MRVIGMASLCAQCGAPRCCCSPPASLPPREAIPLGFACIFPLLPLLSRSSLLTRALRVSPAHLFATPALPPLALSPCPIFSPLPTTSPHPKPSSHGGASLAPCCPNITVRYHCLCCTYSRGFHSWPYSDVPTLPPGVRSYPKASCPGSPMWVSCVWQNCSVWPSRPPDGRMPGQHLPRPQSAGHRCALQHLCRTVVGLLVAGMAPPREFCPALAPLCCLSTPFVCTPADIGARRIVCLDPRASMS